MDKLTQHVKDWFYDLLKTSWSDAMIEEYIQLVFKEDNAAFAEIVEECDAADLKVELALDINCLSAILEWNRILIAKFKSDIEDRIVEIDCLQEEADDNGITNNDRLMESDR